MYNKDIFFELVKTGKLKKAIDILLESSGKIDEDLHDSFLILSSRLSRLDDESSLGTISPDLVTTQKSQLTQSIIKLERELRAMMDSFGDLKTVVKSQESFRENTFLDEKDLPEASQNTATVKIAEQISNSHSEELKRAKVEFLSGKCLHDICELLIVGGIKADSAIDALLSGLDASYSTQLPSEGSPKIRLTNILAQLNSTSRLGSGELPFETVLANAISLIKPRIEAADLEVYLQQLNDKRRQ